MSCDITEVNSDSSLPPAQMEKVRQKEVSPPIVTASTSGTPIFGKEIVVRGTVSRSLTIAIDVAREMAAYKNLIANRGPIQAETTASHEG